jgi:REP element-mobilizing transposase RayT
MAREARRLSETGIYHVIFRGVNRHDIFEGEREEIISYLKNKEKFSIRQIERATGISRGVISRCK